MPRPSRPITLALLAVILAGALVAAVLAGDGDDPRAGSEDLGTGGPPVGVERTLVAYRIDYRVETRTGDDVTPSRERITALRPFASLVETFSAEEEDGRPSSVQVASFGRLALRGPGVEDAVIAPAPAPAPRDLRVAAVLDEAVDAGLLERRERRRVAGRACQVYRSAELMGTADSLAPLDGDQYADTCIDAAGLALEEVLYDEEGDIRIRRVALSVDEDPDVDAADFEVGEPSIPVDQGGGSITPLRPDSRTPESFWELEAPPAGFRHRGRYAVVPPQVEEFTDVTKRERRRASVTDVYEDGPHVIVVERTGTLGSVDVLPDVPHARRVEVRGLGTAEVLLTPSGAEVRIDLGSGRFIRIVGTVPSTDLLDIARALREVEGGTLEPLAE